MSLINETIYQGRAEDKAKGRRVPKGRKRVAYRKGAEGLGYLAAYLVVGSNYNYAIALQPWFAQKNIFVRCVNWSGKA